MIGDCGNIRIFWMKHIQSLTLIIMEMAIMRTSRSYLSKFNTIEVFVTLKEKSLVHKKRIINVIILSDFANLTIAIEYSDLK
jgi:hypothetical protein